MQRTQSGVLWLEHLDNKLRLLANLLKLDGDAHTRVDCAYFLHISASRGVSNLKSRVYAVCQILKQTRANGESLVLHRNHVVNISSQHVILHRLTPHLTPLTTLSHHLVSSPCLVTLSHPRIQA